MTYFTFPDYYEIGIFQIVNTYVRLPKIETVTVSPSECNPVHSASFRGISKVYYEEYPILLVPIIAVNIVTTPPNEFRILFL